MVRMPGRLPRLDWSGRQGTMMLPQPGANVPRTPNRPQPQAGTQPQEGQPPQPVSVLPGVKPFTFHPLLALATLPCEGRSPLRRLISLLKRQADTMHKRVLD
jgi:hypothetical protein